MLTEEIRFTQLIGYIRDHSSELVPAMDYRDCHCCNHLGDTKVLNKEIMPNITYSGLKGLEKALKDTYMQRTFNNTAKVS